MQVYERVLVLAILGVVVVLAAVDIASDLAEGASWRHVGLEAAVGSAACFAMLVIARGFFRIRRRLQQTQQQLNFNQGDLAKWRHLASKHAEGLSAAIDQQLQDWQLSASEKEVSLLLLKGLSLKEIANIRGTHEKTVRAQAGAIYTKSGLSGRSAFAAFFLEDVLVPRS